MRPVINALAAARLTRLVTDDYLTLPLRALVVRAAYRGYSEQQTDQQWVESALDDPSPPRLAKLVTCTACASVWVGAGVLIAERLAPRPWRAVSSALAMALVAEQIAGRTAP